jgi:hypothetical protein
MKVNRFENKVLYQKPVAVSIGAVAPIVGGSCNIGNNPSTFCTPTGNVAQACCISGNFALDCCANGDHAKAAGCGTGIGPVGQCNPTGSGVT